MTKAIRLVSVWSFALLLGLPLAAGKTVETTTTSVAKDLEKALSGALDGKVAELHIATPDNECKTPTAVLTLPSGSEIKLKTACDSKKSVSVTVAQDDAAAFAGSKVGLKLAYADKTIVDTGLAIAIPAASAAPQVLAPQLVCAPDGDADTCFKDAAKRVRSDGLSEILLVVTGENKCDATKTPAPAKLTVDGKSESPPVSCLKDGSFGIRLTSSLKKQVGTAKLEVADAGFEAKTELENTSKTPAAASSGSAKPAVPDLPPVSCQSEHEKDAKGNETATTKCARFTTQREPGTRYVFVDELLSVLPESDPFTTETDRVVIRFIARKAVICRMVARASNDNKYEPKDIRIGGDIANLPPVPSAGVTAEKKAGDVSSSCGVKLTKENGAWTPDPAGTEFVSKDFAFGPYTSEELVFTVGRRDSTLTDLDMEDSFKLTNHLRYSGWFDLVVGLNAYAGPNNANYDIATRPVNGSAERRVYSTRRMTDFHLAAVVKWYAVCSGKNNAAFSPVDIRDANFCFGLTSGLSLSNPLKTYFPIGLHVTLGRFFSLHGMLSLTRGVALDTGAIATGQTFSGGDDDIPKQNRALWGFTVGFGLDPTIFAKLLRTTVTGR